MKNLAYKPKLIQTKNSELSNLKAFFITSIKNNLPVALWHSPTEKKSYGITSFNGISRDNGIKKDSLDFNTFKGFVFSPFHNNINLQINNDLIIDENGLYEINTTNNKVEKFLNQYEQGINASKNTYFKNSFNGTDINYEKDDYINLVSEAIEFIKTGKAQKIVTSRTKKINLDENFDIVNIFDNLVKKYDNAFISLISIPHFGTWIGASPEILLKINNETLTTMSLAGTQIYKGQPFEEVEWGLKEKEEQSMVTEYIENSFISLDAKDFKKSNTETVIAGNVLHIQTMFEYKSKDINSFATEFIKNFHPTPAVCGFPQEISKKFLSENEKHNREFYSGYLGTVNLFEKTELFVNLRCMQVKNDYAVIYVGGGITADSVPEKEWYETELKSRTLLSVINNEL